MLNSRASVDNPIAPRANSFPGWRVSSLRMAVAASGTVVPDRAHATAQTAASMITITASTRRPRGIFIAIPVNPNSRLSSIAKTRKQRAQCAGALADLTFF